MTLASGGDSTLPASQHTANMNNTAGSALGYTHTRHAALADEAISLDSLSYGSMGANRALAGSSFADSEASAGRDSTGYADAYASGSPYGYSNGLGASSLAAAMPMTTGTGAQLSSKPILGGEGTYTVQPLSNPQQLPQQQYAPAAAASDSTAIDVGRSKVGTDALQRGRAEMAADRELRDERSLRSTYSASGTV